MTGLIWHEINRLRWEFEHKYGLALPQTDSLEPSGGIVQFHDWLISNWFTQQTNLSGLDVGCGKGRNTFYLAQKNISMKAFDYSKTAIRRAQKLGAKLRIQNIGFQVHDATKPWPYGNESFDLIINNFGLGDIDSHEGREFAASETTRVLKPGGLLGLHTTSVESDYAQSYNKFGNLLTILGIAVNYGHCFSEQEIIELHPSLILREFSKRMTKITYLGKSFKATNYLNIMQKQ